MRERVGAWLRYNRVDLIGFSVIWWFLGGPSCVFDMSPTACKMYYAVDDFFHPPSSRIETRWIQESDNEGEDSGEDPGE